MPTFCGCCRRRQKAAAEEKDAESGGAHNDASDSSLLVGNLTPQSEISRSVSSKGNEGCGVYDSLIKEASFNSAVSPITQSSAQDGNSLPDAGTSEMQIAVESTPVASVEEAPWHPSCPQSVWANIADLPNEDKAIFEFDRNRYQASQILLPSFRAQIEAQVLADKEPGSEAHLFCSDSTLLRYLCANDGDVEAATNGIRCTLQWRAENLHSIKLASIPGCNEPVVMCPCCMTSPTSHCFMPLGVDSVGRALVNSCAGRSSNKVVEEYVEQIRLTLEHLFNRNVSPVRYYGSSILLGLV